MSTSKEQTYKDKMSAQLNEWNAQIHLLAAKAENATADLKVKYADELEVVRTKQHEHRLRRHACRSLKQKKGAMHVASPLVKFC